MPLYAPVCSSSSAVDPSCARPLSLGRSAAEPPPQLTPPRAAASAARHSTQQHRDVGRHAWSARAPHSGPAHERAEQRQRERTQPHPRAVCVMRSHADDLADGVSQSQGDGGFTQSSTQMDDGSQLASAAAGLEDEVPLTKNDAWHVITAYFDEKGLVRQQLDRSHTHATARTAALHSPRARGLLFPPLLTPLASLRLSLAPQLR